MQLYPKPRALCISSPAGMFQTSPDMAADLQILKLWLISHCNFRRLSRHSSCPVDSVHMASILRRLKLCFLLDTVPNRRSWHAKMGSTPSPPSYSHLLSFMQCLCLNIPQTPVSMDHFGLNNDSSGHRLGPFCTRYYANPTFPLCSSWTQSTQYIRITAVPTRTLLATISHADDALVHACGCTPGATRNQPGNQQ
ncbi:hypothetical protein M011DRAFT_305404 [Sporormia fimetaria CBS 119925]|uniref:Uncharacterized protein n=1 Tax=Sporormia fimetaria CBS 119925 TaxID=1340428 RepID=A0A6A6VJQ7_9PLEO|nr:hypothetical protein M011DRAFT_305404 [Sporormia fimetaria CBS 119925]